MSRNTIRKTKSKRLSKKVSKKTKSKNKKHNLEKITSELNKKETIMKQCFRNKCSKKKGFSSFKKSLCRQEKCKREINTFKNHKKEYLVAKKLINKNSEGNYLHHMKHIMYMEEANINNKDIIKQINDDSRIPSNGRKILISFLNMKPDQKKDKIKTLEKEENSSYF